MSGFTAHAGLVLNLLEDEAGRAPTRGGRVQWLNGAELPWEVGELGSGELVVVPIGFVTDLASVPAAWRWLFPQDGPWVKAAVLHDYLYRTRGLHRRYSRARCDGIFREAMKAVGVPKWRRDVIWLAVRAGGAGAFGS